MHTSWSTIYVTLLNLNLQETNAAQQHLSATLSEIELIESKSSAAADQLAKAKEAIKQNAADSKVFLFCFYALTCRCFAETNLRM
jgi:hypothetical protein